MIKYDIIEYIHSTPLSMQVFRSIRTILFKNHIKTWKKPVMSEYFKDNDRTVALLQKWKKDRHIIDVKSVGLFVYMTKTENQTGYKGGDRHEIY